MCRKPWNGCGARGCSRLRILLVALNARYVQTNPAVRYLAAIARAGGHQVELLEMTVNDRVDTIEAEIDRAAPELLAFSCYLWNILPILEICESLRKVHPALRILLGGPEVSHDAAEYLAANPAVDWIIAGEGESPWSALLRYLPEGPFAGVPGLVWRKGGEIVANPPQNLADLDELPPAYTVDRDDLSHRLLYYEASRGCPFGCAFCLSGSGEGVRFARVERVLQDMESLVPSGAAAIKFVDRTFNCRRDQAMAIWRGLLRFEGRARFHFEIVADLLTPEELAFLQTVPPGLFQFEIGVQSTNPETLAAIGRRTDLARLEKNVRALRTAGNIHLHLDFIAGLPQEDYERFLESLDFGLALAPDTLQAGFLKLLRGTGLRREAEALGYAYRRLPPYEVLSTPWLSFAELNRLKILAHLIEAFYNERRFAHSLPALFARSASPARFFADFAAFYEERGWHRQSHQFKSLPGHLLDFAASYGVDSPALRDRLRLDLHCLGRVEAEPRWAEPLILPDLEDRWRSWLRREENRALLGPEFAAAGLREALRRTKILAFRHDPTAKPGSTDAGSAIVAVVYPERGSGDGARAVKLMLYSS